MSEDESKGEPNHTSRRPNLAATGGGPHPLSFAAVAAFLLMIGIGMLVANRHEPPKPNPQVMSALTPKETIQGAVNSTKATSRLAAESMRAVLNQVDPGNYVPPELPFEITFVPNQAGNGGTMTIDLGDGILVDYVTISGKVTCEFSVVLDDVTKTITVTITMSFDEARIHVDESEKSDFKGTLTLNGAVTATTVLQGPTASCTFTGPLTVQVNKSKATIYTGGVNVTINGLQGTVVFNGSSFIKIEKPLSKNNYTLTWTNLLFRMNTGSIDSGWFKVKKHTGLIKWTANYHFLFPNGGEVTVYPGGLTTPFTLEPPEDTPPPPPPSLTATAVSGTQVNLSWTHPQTDDTNLVRKYRIERRVVGESWPFMATDDLATLKADRTSYTDSTTVKSTAYEYRVLAVNHRGKSLPTVAGVITLPAPLTVHSMSPTEGDWNDEVVITVSNFAENGVSVYFSGSVGERRASTTKTVDASGIMTIVATVPSFLRTGPVVVRSGGQTADAGMFTEN